MALDAIGPTWLGHLHAPSDDLLVVDKIVKSFGGLCAVDSASLRVRRSSVTALIGPNGAGKTSLFNVVSGFVRADAGDVRYDGRSITRLRPHAIARAGLVRTFQLTRTLAFMTVLDNMMVAAPRQPGERLGNLIMRPRTVRHREREVREQARLLLRLLGLNGKEHEDAGALSGGQRKLLELGRVLMLEPRMVLLDEPMAGVNRTLGHELLAHIEQLRATQGTTFLFVEHDMDVVMGHADCVIVMSQGKVLVEGTPSSVRSDPRVIDAYLGTGAV